ncbi:hypothetical protein K443DRAFT_413007 [Laccaria amethystina LaAM-08-1]|uniref:Uncharacterized protein n=1 Tax=Laccaria amethystina LaAM-08-1 TaxID=1095629 RepID=A0A0C9WPZ1_9AGAR|nr:hypothetical protein K443DRAFT_413007 [Laccaria amethystina LaAM-08-1]
MWDGPSFHPPKPQPRVLQWPPPVRILPPATYHIPSLRSDIPPQTSPLAHKALFLLPSTSLLPLPRFVTASPYSTFILLGSPTPDSPRPSIPQISTHSYSIHQGPPGSQRQYTTPTRSYSSSHPPIVLRRLGRGIALLRCLCLISVGFSSQKMKGTKEIETYKKT